MGRAIGIDLGTTNSAMAYIEAEEPKIIPGAEVNERTTPSVVAILNGKPVVGSSAKRSMAMSPEAALFAVKRLMGRRFSDEKVQELIDRMPYAIVEADDDGIALAVDGNIYRPEEISAQILLHLKMRAEEWIGEVTDATITVPAYFDSDQRKATRIAGEIAGLNVLRIISEPTAAAFAYGLATAKAVEPADGEAGMASERKIAVYDLGGGTFDCSILTVCDGEFEVLATSGDPFLGGEDFDLLLTNHVLAEFEAAEGINMSDDLVTFSLVKEACQIAKHDLSVRESADVALVNAGGPGVNLKVSITLDEFEGMIESWIARTIDICRDALNEANLEPSDIDEVLLVGGQTRTPAVQRAVEELFGRPPTKSISPDEIVALGAAIQTGVIRNEISEDVLLLDVIAVTLGTDTVGGRFSPIIPRNTTIPTGETKQYGTVVDNQTQVRVEVRQGEEPMTEDNKLLGAFILTDIKRGPAGQPVDITFVVDHDGIIHAKAVDPQTGAENEITISNATGLTENQIDEMAKRAAENAPAS